MTITVRELRELLAQYPHQDAEVHHAYQYGDYWRTTVAPKVAKVEAAIVEYSEYHRMPAVVDSEEGLEGEPDGPNAVCLIS